MQDTKRQKTWEDLDIRLWPAVRTFVEPRLARGEAVPMSEILAALRPQHPEVTAEDIEIVLRELYDPQPESAAEALERAKELRRYLAQRRAARNEPEPGE